jgi:glycosyltransferase involved in cell wall biosynthesis
MSDQDNRPGAHTVATARPAGSRRRLRIALVTDAWLPQINGVTTTLSTCRERIEQRGHTVKVLSPDLFFNVPCPRYPHIRLAVLPGRKLRRRLDRFLPDAIHIATEGPLGIAARRYCARRRLPFTTAFHTKFAEYLEAYAWVPSRWTYRAQRWFHGGAERTLVPTPTVRNELEKRGFQHLVNWDRGVDTDLFRPRSGNFYNLPRPVFLSVGRVAPEKNLAAFLDLDLPGSKVVVGDGPARDALERAHPEVHWAGFRLGEDLARHYAGADVFVFPSKTDTFGVVMLEANASGLPVAAFPVPGPIDVVEHGVTGVLDDDLGTACRTATEIDPADCRRYAKARSWDRCAELLVENLALIGDGVRRQPLPYGVPTRSRPLPRNPAPSASFR